MSKTASTSGRDFYEHLYQNELEDEAEWLRYGAVEKVNSVEILLNRQGIKPVSILELGCGTGAVIIECQRRGLAREFTAIDYSNEAIGFLKSHSSGIHCTAADITDPNFELEGTFDVVILSHVLEHLEEPSRFVQLLMRKVHFRVMVAEVPLEDLLASRMKNLFRDRTRNTAGHVQFFTEGAFRRFLISSRLDLKDYRRYVPVASLEAITLVRRRHNLSRIATIVKKSTGHYLPRMFGSFWKRFYYAHLAVLCVPKDS
jgi:2-polyprenyl-3-methyl-5-hydroxy-6-metoxy-1,4-benzoquinol methylase